MEEKVEDEERKSKRNDKTDSEVEEITTTPGVTLKDGPDPKMFENIKESFKVPKNFLFKEENTFFQMIRNIMRKEWILVTGPTGCGKTHLAQGATLLLAEGGNNVWYVTGAEMSQQMRSSDQVNEFKNRIMNIPYLVLDEAYVSYDPSGYIQASVSEVLSFRYDRQLPSLLLGNIMDEKGKTNEEKLSNVIGQRLTSRLLSKDNGTLLSMWGCKDIRRK